jgi:hypothetical protein
MQMERVATFARDALSEAHRGVAHLGGDEFLVFGNDGSVESDNVKQELAFVREFLSGQGAEEVALVADAEYGWSLFVRHQRLGTNAGRKSFAEMLGLALWRGWTGEPAKQFIKDADQMGLEAVGECFEGTEGGIVSWVVEAAKPTLRKLWRQDTTEEQATEAVAKFRKLMDRKR